jgi:peroxiredoxin
MTLRWASRIALLGAAALFTMGAFCVAAENPPQAQSPSDFVKDANLQGRVVLVQFGLIGCAMSEEGINKMVALDKERKIEGLAFARIEGNSESALTHRYYAAKALSFPVRFDGDGALVKAFDAGAWPTYVLVDKFGRVRYRGAWPDEAQLGEWTTVLVRETSDAGAKAPMFGAPKLDAPKLLADTRLPDLKGDTKSLKDRMGAKGLLAVFVDTTCPFSAQAISEMTSVDSVLAQHQINTVLVDIGEAKAAVEKFYADKKLAMPVMYDEGKTTQKAWGVSSVPTAVLIDSSDSVVYDGKAVWADVGAAAEKSLALAAGTIKFTAQGTGGG